jgi:hypothetical protein
VTWSKVTGAYQMPIGAVHGRVINLYHGVKRWPCG